MENNLKKEESDLLTKKTILSKEEYQKKSDNLRKWNCDKTSTASGTKTTTKAWN